MDEYNHALKNHGPSYINFIPYKDVLVQLVWQNYHTKIAERLTKDFPLALLSIQDILSERNCCQGTEMHEEEGDLRISL